MKKYITVLFCVLLPYLAFSQWVNDENNYTTGKLGIGFDNPVYQLDISSTLPYIRIHNPEYSNAPTSLVKKGGIIFNQHFSDKTAGIVFAVPKDYHVPGILFATKTAYNQPGAGTTDWYDRMFIHPNGNIGIGTTSPEKKLHITGGEMILEGSSGANPVIFTGIGTSEFNRYLTLINTPGLSSASGLKAGGILISDSYNYANPAKNDLVVKGNIAIGIASAGNFKLYSQGNVRVGGTATIGRSGSNYDEFCFNVGFTSTNNQYTYINNDYASSIRMGVQGGIEFRTAPNGVMGGPLLLSNRMVVKENGFVGINTNNPDSHLTVKGVVHSQEVRVDLNGAVAPDYVFEETYILPTLEEVEAYIKTNKHLSEIPSAKEMEEDGLNLKEMNLLLLKKVEELTLYIIEQDKAISDLKKTRDNAGCETNEMEKIISRLEQLERKVIAR